MNKLPIYEIFIEDDNDFLGLALVDDPAIEKDFIYFDTDVTKMLFNDEKMIVKGPALIPNQLIYRNDKLGERYVFFSEETIVNFVEKLMEKKDNKFNLDHTDVYLNATMLESYFATEPNEFKVPKNSWIVSLKIKDQDVWNKIKSGDYNGFSVQGLFSNEIINNFNKNNEMSELKNKLMEAINGILFGEEVKVEETVIEETVIEETKPEEVVELAEVPVEDVPSPEDVVPTGDTMTPEMMIEKVGELLDQFELDIMSKVEEKIAELTQGFETVSKKVDEFGKQPINSNEEVEVIENNITGGFSTPATRFFPKK